MAGVPSALAEGLTERYVLERELGRGGMATVYLAKDIKHKRYVALKVLHAELSQVLGPERFHREIEFAARLQHPHILGVHDSGEAGGRLWFTMPYVNGQTLRDRLRTEGRLAVDEALRITQEAAQALAYAHKEGVIHRDVKPENILLTEDGSTLVADFGIARAAGAEQEHLTETGIAIGTPAYMAPEQALGGQIVDSRADQYALAAVCYEMLAGEPPFTGSTPAAVIAARYTGPVPALGPKRSEVPPSVEQALQRALALGPEERFETVHQFSQALAGKLLPPTAALPQRRSSSRAPRAVVFLLIGVLLGAGILFGWRYSQQPTPTAPPLNTRAVVQPNGRVDPNQVAILYFRTVSGQDSLIAIADGLTETLIHELSRVKPIHVISAGGVAPFRRADIAPDSIARALGVGTIVDGAVAQSGDRLRVSVSVVDPTTGSEIGSKTVVRPRQEIFALQDDVASEVSIFLRGRLGQEVQLQESRLGTTNAKAWELLQQAEKLTKDFDQLLNAGDTLAAARQLNLADSLLMQAQAMDRKWVRLSIRRGWLAYRQTDLGPEFDKDVYGKWLARGLEHADYALGLNPADADALELRGLLRYWRWLMNLEPGEARSNALLAQAEADLRAAVAANPNAAGAWSMLSHLLMGQSRPAEGKLAALRAYESDPYLVSVKQILWRLFQASLDLEDRPEATHWCNEGFRRFSEYYRFTECQLWLFALRGQTPDIPKAWNLLREYVKLSPPSSRPSNQLYGQLVVSMALARAGLADSARSLALRSRGNATIDPTRDLALLEAIVHTLRGDVGEALRLLSIYVAVNPQFRASLAKDESWWFAALRIDPRYKLLVGERR
jgi:eukaryotic-like serine/threonine-protein kinase